MLFLAVLVMYKSRLSGALLALCSLRVLALLFPSPLLLAPVAIDLPPFPLTNVHSVFHFPLSRKCP